MGKVGDFQRATRRQMGSYGDRLLPMLCTLHVPQVVAVPASLDDIHDSASAPVI